MIPDGVRNSNVFIILKLIVGYIISQCIITRNKANLEMALFFCFCVLYVSLQISFCLPTCFQVVESSLYIAKEEAGLAMKIAA